VRHSISPETPFPAAARARATLANCRSVDQRGPSFRLVFALLVACALQGCGNGAGDMMTANFRSVASDATGTKLVAVAMGGGIWTSTNGGGTWTDRTPSGSGEIQQWMSVASDSTGTKLVAVVFAFYDARGAGFTGEVWTSADSGVTWSNQTGSGSAHGQAWTSVASDATGTKLIAATQGQGTVGPGAIWTSIDSGRTWTNRTASINSKGEQSWMSVASDAKGLNLVAVGPGFGSGVWVSSDGGLTWIDRTPVDPKYAGVGPEGWTSVASDATGRRLVASAEDIWTSPDGGVTWRDAGPTASGQVWFAVASDSTGTNLIAVDGLVRGIDGDVWTSADGGLTWTDQTISDPTASGNWAAVTSNAAGDHFVAIGLGAIWSD
jgi:hypothetical protein